MAAISQDIALALVTSKQECKLAEAMQDVFESRFVPADAPLRQAWQGVQQVTGSQFPAPKLVNSPIVYAQADSRNRFIGPRLFSAAFQAVRSGRHQNERQADEFAARVAAKLGCAPLPILKFLLGIPEDSEHPAGHERAEIVRKAMAEEGVIVPPAQWNDLLVSGSRPATKIAVARASASRLAADVV